jgi:TPR repeat protein
VVSVGDLSQPEPPPEYQRGRGPVSLARRWRRGGAAITRGMAAAARDDGAAAERAFLQADEDGVAEGSFNLGLFYEKHGDADRAIAPYRRAAERGCGLPDGR